MSDVQLNVELRKEKGKQNAKSLRREGKIPAVFYAQNEDTLPLTLKTGDIQRVMQKEVNILSVVFPDGKVRQSIIREIQRDPVTDMVIHVDLMGIHLDKKLKLTIPILLKGQPLGVKEGGVLGHLLREVEVEGFPLDIPEHIEVDVTNMKLGDVILLQDIPITKLRWVVDPHHPVANVIYPKIVKSEAEVAAEAAAAEGEGEEGVEGKEGAEGKEGKEAKEGKEGKAGKEGKEGKAGKEGAKGAKGESK